MRAALFIATLGLASFGVIASVAAAPAKKLDLRSQELYLRTLSGSATKLAPYAGKKVTLLNLWATWCGPCREEIPALGELHEKYKSRGFAVVGVDIDESVDQVKGFLKKHKVTYPMLASTEHRTAEALGDLDALPTSVLIDESGGVIEVLVGGIEVPYLEKLLDTRLGVASTKPPSKSMK